MIWSALADIAPTPLGGGGSAAGDADRQGGVAVMAGDAARASCCRVVAIRALGDELLACLRIVVGDRRGLTAHHARPVVSLKYTEPEAFPVTLAVIASFG